MSYYGTVEDYRQNDEFVLRLRDMRRGDLELAWLRAGRERIECNLDGGRRGLTYMDCNAGAAGYDAVPDRVESPRGAAPRGALVPDGADLDLLWRVDRKSDVWAYKVASFTEEAMSRQWNATRDIPWHELPRYERPQELEIAFAQLCTYFTEIELIATDLPAKWSWQISNQFQEVKHFIATQAMDEARHGEVFRKRALAGGVGLMEALPQNEVVLKAILEAEDYTYASVFMHLLSEGNVLSAFRFSEFISPTPVDKRIFQLVMQDEARHVSYGMQHLRWILDRDPGCRPILHRALDEAETLTIRQFDPTLTECMIVLAGKGTRPDQIREGVRIIGNLQARQIEEYFQRLRRAGFEERVARSRFQAVLADTGLSETASPAAVPAS